MGTQMLSARECQVYSSNFLVDLEEKLWEGFEPNAVAPLANPHLAGKTVINIS